MKIIYISGTIFERAGYSGDTRYKISSWLDIKVFVPGTRVELTYELS